jgi:hypothetical protein
VWLGLRWLQPRAARTRRHGEATTESAPIIGTAARPVAAPRPRVLGRLVWQSWREGWRAMLVALPLGLFLMVADVLIESMVSAQGFAAATPPIITLLVIPALYGALALPGGSARAAVSLSGGPRPRRCGRRGGAAAHVAGACRGDWRRSCSLREDFCSVAFRRVHIESARLLGIALSRGVHLGHRHLLGAGRSPACGAVRDAHGVVLLAHGVRTWAVMLDARSQLGAGGVCSDAALGRLHRFG